MPEWNRDIDRRSFMQRAGATLGAVAMNLDPISIAQRDAFEIEHNAKPVFHIEPDTQRAQINFLSWDTEGGQKARTNLLRPGAHLCLRVNVGGTWRRSDAIEPQIEHSEKQGASYTITVAPGDQLHWAIRSSAERLAMSLSKNGPRTHEVEGIEILFPFDPLVTPTTILPQSWQADGRGKLPAIISSPDFGQILLEASNPSVRLRLEGDRDKHTIDLIVEHSDFGADDECTFTFSPVRLTPPKGMGDAALWSKVRRSWFNAWQPSSRWGDQSRPFSAPVGILANNVISDPVSFALPFYADQALWTPEPAAGISVMDQVRRSIEWWLDYRTDSTGEVIGYWDYRHFLDANPGILISSWDYVEATNDHVWLKQRIEHLAFLSACLERRDVDGDGMVEATQSGNYDTLIEPARSCCWWDALNCGHKDGYTNAFIYRAWRCLADLEAQMGRRDMQKHFTDLAERLKGVYFQTLYNPATGWLAWWKSANGRLHDYATPIVNGLAIEYGLVEPSKGREILSRLRQKMRQANFTRFDLGLPCTLDPVHRADYLQPNGLGVPSRADGTDTFQSYMNGGISAGHTLHFIMAYHIVGEPEKGDEILRAMVERQARIGFENGVRNKANEGIDWTNWTGAPKGYEGYLADVFIFLQAAVLREPSLRARFYRPLSL
jgi:hypothetical protein